MITQKFCLVFTIVSAVQCNNATVGVYMHVRAAMTDEIEVRWERPNCLDDTWPYKLEYSYNHSNGSMSILVDQKLTHYKLMDLLPQTVYYVQLSWKCSNGETESSNQRSVVTQTTDGPWTDNTSMWYDTPMFYFGLGAGATAILVAAVITLAFVTSHKCRKQTYKINKQDGDSPKQGSCKDVSNSTDTEYAVPTYELPPTTIDKLAASKDKGASDGVIQTKRYRKFMDSDIKRSQVNRPESNMYLHPRAVSVSTSNIFFDEMCTEFDSVSTAAADGTDKQLCAITSPVVSCVTGSDPNMHEKRLWRQGAALNETTVQISLSFKTHSRDDISVCADQ